MKLVHNRRWRRRMAFYARKGKPIDFRAAYRAFWLMREMQAAAGRWFWMMGRIEEPTR